MNTFFSRILFQTALLVGIIAAFSFFIHSVQSSNRKLNLILISIDTLRADHMGVYGYPKNTTPNIDKWAKDATVFTNMRTQVPITYPSFSIVMTGRSVFDSKIYNNFFKEDRFAQGFNRIDNRTKTLAEILKENGYSTAAFINTPALDAGLTHINKGFDVYDNDSAAAWLKGPSSNEKYKSYVTIQRGLEWLKKNKDKKTFLWVHLMEPHSPYIPIDKFTCEFNQEFCEEIQSRGREDLEKERKELEQCQETELPKEKVELFKTLYDGAIASADILVEEMLQSIQDLELDKNTVVVLYGDHGEGFDHNYYFMHSHELYDSHIKIPFIIKSPDMKGSINKNYYLNTDIFSTLVDVLNVPHKNGEKPFYYNLLTDSQSSMPFYYYINSDLSKFAIQQGKYKYIYSIKGSSCIYNSWDEELYDLEKDPGEVNNLVLEYPVIVKELKLKLLDYVKKNNLPMTLEEENKRKEQKEKVIEQLKSLGY